MARLPAPDPSTRVAFRVTNSRQMEVLTGKILTLYLDEAGTELADVRAYDPDQPAVPGAVVPGSKVRVERGSAIPRVWLPDGVDTVWAYTLDRATKLKVVADFDARLDRVQGAVTVLNPSGDTTGVTDTAAINASLLANGHTVLAAGAWYVQDVGMVTNNRWLQGSGQATVLNVTAGHAGIVLTGPGNVRVSDLKLSGGDYGIRVNGCYDSEFANLHLTGHTLGGVKINGDLATEQHWSDVTLRGVGGKGFAIDRTTSIYTGSVYMDRVRIVEPANGATHGFYFNSAAGSPSLNIAFMDMCVADNYGGDAYYANNCGQIFANKCWFAINGAGPSGAAAMRIIGGFQHSYSNCYTYSGRTSPSDPSVVLSGTQAGVLIDGHTFDGTPTTVALGVTASSAYGWKLGSYSLSGITTLADVPAKVPVPQPTRPGTTAVHGEETLSRLDLNTVVQLTPGTLLLSYFTATKTELISTIEAQVNEARSGGTYVGYGLYTVGDDGLLTLVAKAEQTSGLTLWNSAFQPVGGFDTKLGFGTPSTYQKRAGQRYAVGVLQVGGTGVKLIAALQSNGTPGSSLAVASTPLGMIAAVKAGQTTLGTVGSTTHTQASLSGSGSVPYFVLN